MRASGIITVGVKELDGRHVKRTEIRNKPDSVLNYHSSRARVTPGLKHPTRELLEQTQRSPTWACTS